MKADITPEKAQEQIYRLHRLGHDVPKIAKQLALDEDVVRGYIVKQWHDDKEAERLAKRTIQW